MTDCLERPQGQYTEPPQPPATLTDEWARVIWGWANRTLGTATKDRKAWGGERECIRGKAKTGAIR